MFFFRRVIFDELHELQGGAKGDAQRVQRCLLTKDTDPQLLENCSRFLDACVRRNCAEVPKIRVTQHLRLVRHTPQERIRR
eukprot:Skav229357  [mRNA]  locus=scaffold3209:29225:30426:- [translate_table: standard]